MMEHTGVTMRGQEHEQGRVEGVSPTEFMGVKIRVKIVRPYNWYGGRARGAGSPSCADGNLCAFNRRYLENRGSV